LLAAGLYAAEMLARGAEVIGLDLSPEMVRLARQRLGEDFDVRVQDLASPLDLLSSESFDAVVLALVLHHLDDRMAALRELNRVLRPDGRLVSLPTIQPLTGCELGGSYFSVEPVEEDWHEGQWHVRYWRQPLSKTCSEFADAGFLVEGLWSPFHRQRWPNGSPPTLPS
jgi:ubiquinone/menaquinone biosynthesis C-methylase UbiE